MTEAIKPPPQTLGVTGISTAALTPSTPPPVNWDRLVHLPPFQVYAAEQIRINAVAGAAGSYPASTARAG